MNPITKNFETLDKYRERFKTVFGFDLAKTMHPIYGFDTTMLDALLRTPPDVSTATRVQSLFGDDALKLVLEILGENQNGRANKDSNSA